MDYKQIAIAGVLNSAYASLMGVESVDLPLLGNIQGLFGSFAQGMLSNSLFQAIVPLVAIDVAQEETNYKWTPSTTVNSYIIGGGAGAASQLTVSRVLSTNQTSSLSDAVQGAVVNVGSAMVAATME